MRIKHAKISKRQDRPAPPSYKQFLDRKTQVGSDHGFDPIWMPDQLFDFQRALVEWAQQKGRAAIFADCGLGKTPIQLTWAENGIRETSGRILILTPLAVGAQTVREGEKFGIETYQSRDGKWPATKKIIVTNYEKLHLFKPTDFIGCVCDESSILKNFNGATRAAITDFMRKIRYRLLCTATAAPNDYIELGTSSEALGVLERKHMMAQFFTHDGGDTAKWRIKGHVRAHLFWKWMCSWARAVRKPSDLGFDNAEFDLPALSIKQHIVSGMEPPSGFLLDLPAIGLKEQRNDLRRTINERCELAADIANAHNKPVISWCNLNAEGDLLLNLIPDSIQISGADSDDEKEDKFTRFIKGDTRVLITKPSIGGFGLNMQHCANQIYFPSHSFEQYYQCVRRSWRFGQKKPVTIDMVTTNGQGDVMRNLEKKSKQAAHMFEKMVLLMANEMHIEKVNDYTKKEDIPSWL